MSEKTIALLGQPNSGKSTLFNGLTGSRQHVGNWPGKTVERKDGSFVHKDTTYKIIDLPGTYSLSANSDEEVVTRNYIASGQADVVCILADASQLNRSLFMLADYTGIRVPVVLLLNMMDVAKSQGKQIDTNGIAKSLGIPVVPLVAADKKQYGTFFRMLESIDKNASTLDEKRLAQIYQNTIGAAFDEIKALLPADGIGIYSSTWSTAKLIEQDKLARSLVKETVDAGTYTAVEKKLSGVKDGNLLTGDCKFQWIDKLVNENVTSKKNKLLRSRFDKAATSKRWGKPIAIGMIVLGLICSMVIGFPLMGLFSGLISAISVPLANWLLDIGAAPFLVSLLCNAILTAVSFALQMASYVFGISKKNKLLRSRFDKAATSKRWGKPIAIGMIVLGLICSMVIGFPLMGLFSGLISAISVPLANWLLDIGAAPFLVSLLCNAILTAVSFALQMASYVFGISLVFGLMEDVGYMARISYVFDDTMTKLGLQGKAIMPFLVSFGCNIGGITGTRVIDSWGQRVMTIALSWVVPCASSWGVVGLVSGTFFGNGAAVVVLALFAVAFLHIFITYKVFGRSLNKVEGRTGLIMELPPYHKPHWKSLFGSVFSKMGNVLSRALRIIICISVIFWLLSYSADGNVANSIIYKVGTFIEPMTSLFGLPWQLFIAFVASTMGKEASLGVMASLFNTGSIWAAIEQSATVDTAALSTSMLSVISRPEALAFLFAFFFNMPCLMALTATAQETHSMKWTVRIALYYVLTALIMATIAYHVGLVIF